jgi:hypothetical protein
VLVNAGQMESMWLNMPAATLGTAAPLTKVLLLYYTLSHNAVHSQLLLGVTTSLGAMLGAFTHYWYWCLYYLAFFVFYSRTVYRG